MTVDKFNIKRVGIIGGGVAGIGALNELLHTKSDGSTAFGLSNPSTSSSSELTLPSTEAAFPDVVLFERSDELGGNWQIPRKSDPVFPSQEVLDAGEYNIPQVLDPPLGSIPSDEELSRSSVSSPLIRPHDFTNRWSNSAAYPALFSNIIAPLVRLPNGLKFYQEEKDREIHPFSTAGEIQRDLYRTAEGFDLIKHIRFSTTVERVQKVGDKWQLVLRKSGLESDEWYVEYFDALITANGHYSIPFIPIIENLNNYNRNHPGALLHTKGIKNFEQFKDKDVLIIGSHASSVDVIKFLLSNAKSITVSRRTMENPNKVGIEEVLRQPEINTKPKIKLFHRDSVEFIDGTTGKFDKVIFATGYHYHYPFLVDQSLVKLGQIVDKNSKFSLVKNLYLYAFSVEDPTFATIGVQQSPYLFATMEAQAAAIAGVWSNYKQLPSKEEQYAWLNNRNEEGVYHIYNVETAKVNLADPCIELAPKEREHPFEVTGVQPDDVKDGWTHLLKIYALFRDGALSYDKVRKLDSSKKALSVQIETS